MTQEMADQVLGLLEERAQETRENKERYATEESIRSNLAVLGGKLRSDDDIEYAGKKIVLPLNTTIRQNIKFLTRKLEEDENETEFSQTYNYRPWDGAHALWAVLKEQFGGVGHKDGGLNMFGMAMRPEMHSIAVGFGKNEQIPWGRFEIPTIAGAVFETDMAPHPQKGPLFHLNVTAPKKWQYEIQGIFRLVEEYLQRNSIYRGKAFDGQVMPNFINPYAVDAGSVVYSQKVMTELEASVWSQLRHSEEFRKAGKSLKRAVLLFGPYGTGKTLACMLTAQEADLAGWTFIQARAGRDELGVVLQTAKLYEPAVVFFEDIDTIAGVEEQDINRLLDDFDGMGAKGTEIMMVLTTNHRERLHKGMARPGRLDAMIEINELDQAGVEKLVRTRINNILADEIDWAAVYRATRLEPDNPESEGYKPAFVTEGADRTFRYLLARHGNLEGQQVDTEALVNAMEGLRDQYELMIGAKDVGERDTLTELLRREIDGSIERHRVDYDGQGELVEIRSS